MAWRVEFIEVGRNKRSWSKVYRTKPTEGGLVRDAKLGALLMSSDVWLTEDGSICAGMNTVGRFTMGRVDEQARKLKERTT